jgi:tripartite-type tricarboxylate transporter receptor subunit TctC
MNKSLFATLRRAVLLAALAVIPAAHAADAWPSKPIRLIVPYAAGGPTDIAARVIAQALGESLKTTVIVENKGGGNGFIGALDTAKSPADGYTVMMSSLAMAINPLLYEKVPYDPNKDFAPLSLVLTIPMVAVVNPKVLPVDSVPALVSYLKAHPDSVNYASSGTGGSSHLIAEYFKSSTGTMMTHVAYKGSGPAVTGLVAGEVQLMFDTLLSTAPQVKAGNLRMLAVATSKRLPDYPDVPTIAESLGTDFEASSWYGMYVPAGTPQDIVKKLSAEINRTLTTPEVKKRLADLGAVTIGSTPQELADYQRAEQAKWRKVIEAGKIKL